MKRENSTTDISSVDIIQKKGRQGTSEMIIPRTLLNLRNLEGVKPIKIISWNVAGLRGTLKNNPQIFSELVSKYHPDAICLQETKLQDNHPAELENLIEGYRSYWNCATVKKGYSGTAVFIKKDIDNTEKRNSKPNNKQTKLSSFWGAKKIKDETVHQSPSETAILNSDVSTPHVKVIKVYLDLPDAKFNGEGRIITVEFDSFFLVNVYVPNSGEGLVRLDFRVGEWDPYIVSYLQSLREKKPVVYAGDLNVGHLDLDIYNPEAKHISKQSSLTPQERHSFSQFLEAGFFDSLRELYPTAEGQFTYWSIRTSARTPNKGLRLDYFVCSNDMKPDAPDSRGVTVLDSYILHEDTVGCSDHCPIMLVLKTT